MAPLAFGHPRSIGARREEFSGPYIGEDTVAVVDEAIASVGNVKPTTWPSATRRSSFAIIGDPRSTPPPSHHFRYESVVAIPVSKWYVLWQWSIHWPGLSASMSNSTDDIGSTLTVSLRALPCPTISKV